LCVESLTRVFAAFCAITTWKFPQLAFEICRRCEETSGTSVAPPTLRRSHDNWDMEVRPQQFLRPFWWYFLVTGTNRCHS
jgi:hypothetical protein